MNTDDRLTAIVKSQSGYTYSGTLWRGPAPSKFEVGLSPTPAEAAQWFGKVAPAVARFARIFSPPGHGLPNWTGTAISGLPTGCLPWISHKDPVPLDTVAAYWRTMASTAGVYRWTYHHEPAPGDDEFRAAYFAYWRQLQALAIDFPGIELVQVHSNYAMRWRPDTFWRSWIVPGVTMGFDCYPLLGHRYEPPESMFGLLRAAAAFANVTTWGVPELGADVRGTQDRANWISECVDYLRDAGAAFVGLWCAQDPHSGLDYRPTDNLTLGAYQDALA